MHSALLHVVAKVGLSAEDLTLSVRIFPHKCLRHVQEAYRKKQVEWFTGTLKSMLKKFVSWSQKVWDDYLPYLLFAYCEAPQETTGFSPFELPFGRKVRGPLDVLREEWTGEAGEEVPVAVHVVEMRDRLQQMTDLVQEKAQKAQQCQKSSYDRGARPRDLELEQQVLVLLPSQGNHF